MNYLVPVLPRADEDQTIYVNQTSTRDKSEKDIIPKHNKGSPSDIDRDRQHCMHHIMRRDPV